MPLIRKDLPLPDDPPGADLLAALRSGASEERWSAARDLAKTPDSAPILGTAIQTEKDARVREAIFTSLAHIRTPAAVEAILPYVRSEDAAIRSGALDALMAMPEAVASHIPELLADPDPDFRLLICEVVRRLPSSLATTALCALLERESVANVCAAAIEALSEVGEREALPVLARCADRFKDEPFLIFAINAASDRIGGNGRASEPRVS